MVDKLKIRNEFYLDGENLNGKLLEITTCKKSMKSEISDKGNHTSF